MGAKEGGKKARLLLLPFYHALGGNTYHYCKKGMPTPHVHVLYGVSCVSVSVSLLFLGGQWTVSLGRKEKQGETGTWQGVAWGSGRRGMPMPLSLSVWQWGNGQAGAGGLPFSYLYMCVKTACSGILWRTRWEEVVVVSLGEEVPCLPAFSSVLSQFLEAFFWWCLMNKTEEGETCTCVGGVENDWRTCPSQCSTYLWKRTWYAIIPFPHHTLMYVKMIICGMVGMTSQQKATIPFPGRHVRRKKEEVGSMYLLQTNILMTISEKHVWKEN